jgi:LuxR family maltose regulon positive regulatory protein
MADKANEKGIALPRMFAPHARRHEDRRVIRAVGFVPLEVKLHIPPPQDGLVLRGELVDRLRESRDTPVIVITAPPGYGKTTLLRQWESEDERRFAWLTLDQGDNDAETFLTYLLIALQRLEPVDVGILASMSADAERISGVLLPRLGRMLRTRRPFVIALDEADSLTSAAALEVLTVLIDNLLPGCQLAMVARHAPDLPWGRLRSQRQLLEIGLPDLRLNAVEAAALLDATGVKAEPESVADLLDQTEGWAAGLYLAARYLAATAGRAKQTVADFTGSDGVVADYLRELLLGLPPGDQTFLMQLSLLKRFCGALCDDVLSTSGSGVRLRELYISNLFVVSLDGSQTWYRFHHLFAEMLQAELDRVDPRTTKELHTRASRWLEANGDIAEATEHAHDAGEVSRAAALLWRQVSSSLATGRRSDLERVLDTFSNEQVLGNARLALTAAWCAIERGRPVEHWITAAERGRYDADCPGETESVAAAIALLRATLAQHGVARMAADTRLAAGLQAPDDPWRGLTSYLAAVAAYLMGDAAAPAMLETAEQLGLALDIPAVRALTMAQLAIVAVEDNDWVRAAALTADAVSLLEENRLGESPTLHPVWCLSTLIAAKQGRVEEAQVAARRAMRMVALIAHHAPWCAVQSRYLLARAHLMLGNNAAARILLSEAQNHLTSTPDAEVLAARLEEAWQQVAKSPLALGSRVSTLTSAELRVLQLLPTHLSFEQIGARLFISRNTVKTQAISAYRKLGVSSRSEAVERGEALGMVTVRGADGRRPADSTRRSEATG